MKPASKRWKSMSLRRMCEELKKKISELLTQKPLTPVEIADKIEAEKESISEVIQYLLEEGEWKMQDGMIHISK